MILETLIALTVLTNAARVEPLVPSVELSAISQARAEEMCRSGELSHKGFYAANHPGSEFWGENIAKGFSSIEKAHKAWLKSPTHYANIVRPTHKKMGVGEACGIIVVTFRD